VFAPIAVEEVMERMAPCADLVHALLFRRHLVIMLLNTKPRFCQNSASSTSFSQNRAQIPHSLDWNGQ
jgi:hypothetical protein